MNTEEYVPTMHPTISDKLNPMRDVMLFAAANIYRVTTAISVVTVVLMVLARVCQTLTLTMVAMPDFCILRAFSRILS